MMQVIKAADYGRWFAHLIFSAMFIYDIVWLGNPFGFNNAGIYAAVTIGSEAILKLAQLKYGGVNANAIEGRNGMDGEQPDTDIRGCSVSHWGRVSALPDESAGAGKDGEGSNGNGGGH